MAYTFTKHRKVSLRRDALVNEKWLHDRITEDPQIIGLGEVRVLAREKAIAGGGRLDMLLFDDDNSRRYEVEIQFGPTDPSHIIRCIEYWDVERRRYPGYEHVAVLVAENITTRFLNVIALLSGSIPLIAIQLDALSVGDNLLLNFTHVLDQTELRIDDTDEEEGGGGADRTYWDKKAGPALMEICDQTLQMINEHSSSPQELSYLKGYIGLRSNGVVNNFIVMSPKPQKKIVNLRFRKSNAVTWKDRFEQAGVPVISKHSDHLKLAVTPAEFSEHKNLIREVVGETVKECEG